MIGKKEQQKIDEACLPLASLGLKGMIMGLVFNDGSNFVLSGGELSVTGFQQDFNKEVLCFSSKLAADQPLFLNKQELLVLSSKFAEFLEQRYELHPVCTLIREHTECALVFIGIGGDLRLANRKFDERFIKKFEDFCVNFSDKAIDLVGNCNPIFKFSYIFSSQSIRQAVIKQGYDEEISLSAREQECLWHASYGKSAKQVAQMLGISNRTVENHSRLTVHR